MERDDVKRGDVLITCLVRGEARAKLLRDQLGVQTLVGDLADVDIIVAAAHEADSMWSLSRSMSIVKPLPHCTVVVDTANADFPKGGRAILDGLKRRYQETGITSIFIHVSTPPESDEITTSCSVAYVQISGTGALTDNAHGKFASEKM